MKRTFHIFSLALIVSLLISAVGLPPTSAQAATGAWEYVGPAGFAVGNPVQLHVSLAFDTGIPYVAFTDYANGSKVSVMKFNGTDWVNVGPAGFSSGWANQISIVFDNGIPYVSLVDGASKKVSVMKFDALSGNWVHVGPAGFSIGWALSRVSLAFNGGVPYVAYTDTQTSPSKIFVMKFDAPSGNWVDVGTTGFTGTAGSYRSLVFDNGTLYLTYQDGASGWKASVMKFVANSGNWVNVGPAGFSSGRAEYISLALDSGTPYVLYADGANSNKASVMKFNGTDWVNVGPAGFSTDQISNPSLAVTSGMPYVAFQDVTNSWKLSVMKFDALSGNWVYVGPAGFSTGSAYVPSLAINNGMPYVAFIDEANDYKINVMKFASASIPSAPTITSPTSPTNDSSPTVSGTADPGSLVTVKYDDSVTSSWVTVCDNLTADATTGAWTCVWPASPFAVIAEGNFSLSAKAYNGSSYSPETIVNYVLDLTGPHDPVVTSPTSPTNDSTPTISGTADPGVRVTVGYQDSTMSAGKIICNSLVADAVTGAWTCAWPDSFPTITEGNFKVGAAAYDGVNYSNEVFFHYVLDLTAPSAPVVTAPPAYTNDSTPTISGTAEANSKINVWYRDNSNSLVKICNNVSVDGTGSWSCTSSVTLPERAIQLTVKATDAAGNTSSETTRSFTVDLTAPPAPVVNAPTGMTNDSTPTISGSAEANSKINVSYNLAPVCSNVSVSGAGAWSCESSVALPAGSVELKVNATDAAGNRSADASHSFTIKLSAPTVTSIVRVGATPTSAASVDFTVTFSEPVKDVDTNDFSLYTTGNITGASVSGVKGSGTTYTVSVNTGTKNGTLRLDVPASATITDLVGNALSLPFTTGEAYTIFKTNGPDTTGVFRPSNGLLYLKNQNTTGFADVAINYGLGGDYPVVGDWDGNGTVTIGIYRNGKFYLRNENSLGFADMVFAFGLPGDQPIAGDWDGDGFDTIGVYRPSTGLFLLRNSNTAGDAEMSFYLGNTGDVGIAGDWDGDGKDTTGVFRPSNGFLFLKNTNATGYADLALNYGLSGDKPVTGDWDGDGDATIGVYRGNTFYLRNENTNGFADIVFSLGNPGDMPIAGNWDGLP